MVLNWNGGDDTLACLASLRREGITEVIVVDNASTDGSDDRVVAEYPEAVLIRNDENLGFSGGNNVGIREALQRGHERVFLLNNDAELQPGSLACLERALDEDPDLGAVCPLIVFADRPDVAWYAGATFDPTRARSGRMLGYREPTGPWVQRMPRRSERGVGAAMLVRREVFERAGMLDEELFFLFEDVDWSLRMRKSGFGIGFVPEAVVGHRVAGSQGGSEVTPLTLYYLTRNHLFVCQRHAPLGGWQYAIRTAGITAIHLAEAVRTARPRHRGVAAVARGARDFRHGRMGHVW